MAQLIKDKTLELNSNWSIDHVCYRVETEIDYLKTKKEFESFGLLLVESMVGGRLIATYKMHSAFEFLGQSVDLIELPMPKNTKNYQEGFQHFEVVCDVPFELLQKRYAHLKQNLKGLEKTFNKEFEVFLEGDYSVKFHHQSLEKVIELELAEGKIPLT